MERRGKAVIREKEIFVGIEVHKESWQVSIVREGEEVFHGRIPSRFPALRKVLDRYRGSRIKVAYEAGRQC